MTKAEHHEAFSTASMALFRIMYGLVMCYSLIRFMLSGWVEELWIKPTFFFKYAWATWMPVWEPTGLYLHISITLLAALGVTLGLFYKASLLVFVTSFIGLQLFDQTNYLNHYYLVICLSMPLFLSPAGQRFSLDCLWREKAVLISTEAWPLYLLRFQLGLVYVFAAIAKIESDWLFYGQPLSIWLSSRVDLPFIGPLFSLDYTPLIMSWCGFLYDLLIVPALLWSTTRLWAYLVVIGFHSMTHILFDIGIFPLLMTLLTPIFFHPNWPITLWEKIKNMMGDQHKDLHTHQPMESYSTHHFSIQKPWLKRSIIGFICIWCTFHIIFPLRTLWLEDNVLWSERGMRYSWRVMLREKNGSLTYRVKSLSSQREWEVNPKAYLTPRQLSEMSGQADMIVQLSHWIKQDFETRLKQKVAVYADIWVSLNGRPPKRMLNPNLDLTQVELDDPRLILAPPLNPPLHSF